MERNLAFYNVAVQYRCAVTTSLAVARGGGARGWAPYLLVTQRYLRGIATELSSYTGVVDEPVELPDPPPTDRTAWYDSLMEAIRAGVRGIGDPELKQDTRNHQILVHYLRAYDLMGPRIAELEREDCLAVTGLDPAEAQQLETASREAGAAGDTEMLRYLSRRRRRQAHLWRTVMDR